MNYIKEINSFYDWLETNSVPDSAIVLWHALMHINNKAGWVPEFTVAISTLSLKTGLKKDAILRARHRLQQSQRIDFTSRAGQLSASYKIIPFDCVVLNDSNRNTNREQTATQTENKPQHKPRPLLNNTKLNKTLNRVYEPAPEIIPDNQKKKYADYVYLTEAEYDKLTEKLGEEEREKYFLRFAAWISGQTKRVQESRSAYLTILNWHRDSPNKQTAIITKKSFNPPTAAPKEKEVELYIRPSS